LIQGLLKPDIYCHETHSIRLLETHCAWVVLTGLYAYKIKKPVNFGFLDFSTLEKRKFYCEEELRLNRRFAPDIYLEVVTITGTRACPQINGDGQALEYAVRMRQFPDNGLLSQLAARKELETGHIDQLIDNISDFHRHADKAGADDQFGNPEKIHHWVRENFQHIQPLLTSMNEKADVEQLQQWSEKQYMRLTTVLQQRKQSGAVRECHGDLHLGNITLIDGRVTPFDCIEFNPELRWIDVISEIAFVLMDLDERGLPRYSHRFLNGYLQQTGDYAGLVVLPYYQVYRAMVRAKVAKLRCQQTPSAATDHVQAEAEYRQYLQLALRYTARARAVMVIMRGLSGSGKSTVARDLCEQTGMIQLRSDVERKRQAGLAATATSHSGIDNGLYSSDKTTETYRQLGILAKSVLEAGYSALIDATFLKREHRDHFRAQAAASGTAFLIIECAAPDSELERRILTRQASQQDASEATLEVLHAQQALDEPLSDAEQPYLLRADTGQTGNKSTPGAFLHWFTSQTGDTAV
ncbi:MAG: AAA family ATPase, partial [Gammaproteobacteria bacterium]|nr:AAA family ATPase [Gammaproteobacteria bacterium]